MRWGGTVHSSFLERSPTMAARKKKTKKKATKKKRK